MTERMKQKRFYKLILFFVLLVMCLLNSQTIGNSFSVQGSSSSIVRLKITKSIKNFKTNTIKDSKPNPTERMIVVISEGRHGIGSSLQDDNTFIQQNRTNKYESQTVLYCKSRNIDMPLNLGTTTRQILRI
jgi:hypothetical protein